MINKWTEFSIFRFTGIASYVSERGAFLFRSREVASSPGKAARCTAKMGASESEGFGIKTFPEPYKLELLFFLVSVSSSVKWG